MAYNTTAEGNTALMNACRMSGFAGISGLIAAADINVADNNGKTALMIAMVSGKPSLISTLLRGGATVDAASIDVGQEEQ